MKKELQLSSVKGREMLEYFNSKELIFPVHKQLDPFIFSYLHGKINFPFIDKFVSRPIPTGCIVMFIHFGSEVVLYDHHFKNPKRYSCFIVGVQALNKLFYLHAPGNVENLIIAFKPGGFSRIFNCSAFSIMNRVVEIENLLEPDMKGTLKEIATTSDIEARISKLNEFLLDLLSKSSYNTRKNHLEVLDMIHRNYGNVNLQEICENLNITLRTMQRSFQVNVGISPKEYIRIVRFNNVFQYLLDDRFEDWQDIVYRFGYYDQSHFIHDFKLVTGYTPQKFIDFQQHGAIYLDRFQVVRKISDLLR
ncbi:MAG: AraC family transcriptional regulator [Bacteroidales bacterium]|nr:AraC family transcriptional regulator [Bacteroidales bacterium]